MSTGEYADGNKELLPVLPAVAKIGSETKRERLRLPRRLKFDIPIEEQAIESVSAALADVATEPRELVGRSPITQQELSHGTGCNAGPQAQAHH